MKTIILLILSILSITCYARHEPDASTTERFASYSLPNTQVRYLHSNSVNKDYALYINLPASYYSHPKDKYPTLFLLDADYSFPLATAIVEHLSDRGLIPEMLIVGIAYAGPTQYELNRTRDYTPTPDPDVGYGVQYQKASGGADHFANFLQSELIPFVQQQYHTNHERTLVGHSYGGLFDSWLMLHSPTAFSSYIIVSPSLWYDNHTMFTDEANRTKSLHDLPVSAFFVIGDAENKGDYKMVDDMTRYVSLLQSHHYKNLKVYSAVLSPENHDTIFPAGLTQGLIALYGEQSK